MHPIKDTHSESLRLKICSESEAPVDIRAHVGEHKLAVHVVARSSASTNVCFAKFLRTKRAPTSFARAAACASEHQHLTSSSSTFWLCSSSSSASPARVRMARQSLSRSPRHGSQCQHRTKSRGGGADAEPPPAAAGADASSNRGALFSTSCEEQTCLIRQGARSARRASLSAWRTWSPSDMRLGSVPN